MKSVAIASLSLMTLITAGRAQAQEWPVHSMDRPRPPVIDPGPAGPPVAVPEDAIVLFDGTSLDEWRSQRGGAGWRIEGGYVEVVGGAGSISTRRAFGDVQLHVEWATPATVEGDGQARGNSGVFLMGRYEIQVLDSHRNETYADGQAAAIYGQEPPLVNASRPPGEWQTYDIVFRRPRFGDDGTLLDSARTTVFHNGVLVHDAVPFRGGTVHQARATYAPHENRLPLMLQDHGNPVRFRNIWIRDLER